MRRAAGVVAVTITGLAMIGAPLMVGKPRKPYSRQDAVAAATLNGILFTSVLVLWRT